MDVKNTFLYGDLTYRTLMKQPLGYVAQEETEFRKAIYELKQSPQTWFEKFSSVIMDGGLQRCIVDHLVFYKRIDNGCVILIIYVNDNLLIRSDLTAIAETKKYHRTHFVTKDMDKLKYFLNIEFAYSRNR